MYTCIQTGCGSLKYDTIEYRHKERYTDWLWKCRVWHYKSTDTKRGIQTGCGSVEYGTIRVQTPREVYRQAVEV